jgi:UDP:flavonoid glycosyltransferase YjiC (YdhE family)
MSTPTADPHINAIDHADLKKPKPDTTQFPELPDSRPQIVPDRVDSESTLYDYPADAAISAATQVPVDLASTIPTQLDLTKTRSHTTPHDHSSKFFTPDLRAVTPSYDHPDATAASPDDSDSESSDGSLSDEEQERIALRRSQTSPDYRSTSIARMNRVQRGPAHTSSKKRTHRRKLKVYNDHFTSLAKVARDGRLTLSINEFANSGYLGKAIGATIGSPIRPHAQAELDVREANRERVQTLQQKGQLLVPRMNIVIMVIGSRGDIQPFLKIGKILRDKYQHRVRIATHPTFRKFVEEDVGLEFFSVGGDPSELMAFMVKNPGLIPSLETIKAGEISKRRESMFEMFQGFWRACINSTDDETDIANINMLNARPPFIADAIIANPPSFAHFCCAQRLGIPLHLVFTFPYSPTQAFPHPLANIKSTNVDQSYTNYMSYPLVDLMTWQGLGDLVNRFRVQTLGLEPVSTLWAPGQLSRSRVSMTYLWSPGLVPKPADWGPEINIAGYVFLDLASRYKPPADLETFLDRSDSRSVVYIGFGSIAGIDDPAAFTRMIFEAVELANVRAVISRGWGGMGDGMDKPDGVFMIDNVPHDWLFDKVDAVVHHGGAGTTAAGLRAGKPTMIVPFFGDQPFWSAMVAKAGAGAKQALPLRKLNAELFAEGIKQCLEPDAKAKAQEIAESIALEGDGAENAVDLFHQSLPLTGEHSMRCSVFADRVAVWTLRVKHKNVKLSNLAAQMLVENSPIEWRDLQLLRHREWVDFQGPGEPITGAGGVLVSAFQDAFHGLSSAAEMARQDWQKMDRRRRKRKGHSVADAVTLAGQAAVSARGASAEVARKEMRRLDASLNLRGEAEPLRRPFSLARTRTVSYEKSGLYRTDTASTTHTNGAILIVKDVGRGVGHSAKALFRMPSRMFYAFQNGLRNSPKLYGDPTVRPEPYNITGFRSGCKVAGVEFYNGFYDGITGVVRLPQLAYKEEGASGLPLGIVKGVGGLVIKPVAGTLGLAAYTGKGYFVSLHHQFRDTGRTDRWIRRARKLQGGYDIQELKKQSDAKTAQEASGAQREEIETLEEAKAKVMKLWATQQQPHEATRPNEDDGTSAAAQETSPPTIRSSVSRPSRAETF